MLMKSSRQGYILTKGHSSSLSPFPGLQIKTIPKQHNFELVQIENRKTNVSQKLKFFLARLENVVTEGKYAICTFYTVFHKAFSYGSLKLRNVGKKVQQNILSYLEGLLYECWPKL